MIIFIEIIPPKKNIWIGLLNFEIIYDGKNKYEKMGRCSTFLDSDVPNYPIGPSNYPRQFSERVLVHVSKRLKTSRRRMLARESEVDRMILNSLNRNPLFHSLR